MNYRRIRREVGGWHKPQVLPPTLLLHPSGVFLVWVSCPGGCTTGYLLVPLRGRADGKDPEGVSEGSRWCNHRCTRPPHAPWRGAGVASGEARRLTPHRRAGEGTTGDEVYESFVVRFSARCLTSVMSCHCPIGQWHYSGLRMSEPWES